jgi:hypothetical protein
MQASKTVLDLNLKHGLAGHGDCFWGQCSRSQCSNPTISLTFSAKRSRVTGDESVQLRQTYAVGITKSFRQQSVGTSVKTVSRHQNWIRLHNRTLDRLKSQRMGTETFDWGQQSVGRPVPKGVKCRAAAVSFNVRTPTKYGEASFKKRSPREQSSDCEAQLGVFSNPLLLSATVFPMMISSRVS